MARHYPVTHHKIGYIGPDGNNVAGGLASGDEGGVRAELIFSSQHQNIDKLDATCLDPDLEFPNSR
ncbi:MAG TPA: hypothetical protein VGM32_14290 [Rhodopila sp.]